MAETNNRKRTPSSAAPSGKADKASSKPKNVTATAASRVPAKSTPAGTRKKTTSATAASRKPSAPKGEPKGKVPDQQAAKIQQRSTFSEQFLPYIFGGLALILTVCFILNAVGDAQTPEEHLMGFVGYYLCFTLFGCFGWTAYLIPLLLVNLAVFWRRYCEERLVAV